MLVDDLTRSWTYPQAAAICAGAAGVAASLAVAPNLLGVCGAGLVFLAVAIAVVDARYLLIPNELNAAALALALLHAAIANPQAAVVVIAFAVLRGAVLALMFLGLRAAYRRLRNREGIGLGDVKLAGVAGAWLDWPVMPIAVEIAALAALTVYAVRQRTLGRSVRSTGRLPFGLFFAPAIWLGWLIETIWLAPQ